jgi:hypothetical protein
MNKVINQFRAEGGVSVTSYDPPVDDDVTVEQAAPASVGTQRLRYRFDYRPCGLIVGGQKNPNGREYQHVESLPTAIDVTDVHVYAHDRRGNVTKAILRVEAQGTPLTPDWQDVKRAGDWEYYTAPGGDAVRASWLRFTSHHIGHIAGGDETVILEVLVYGS